MVSTEVPPLLAGVRVDRGVAMVADVSRAAAAELVAAGRVEVDGVVVTAGRAPLPVGAVLTVRLGVGRSRGPRGRAGGPLRGGPRGRADGGGGQAGGTGGPPGRRARNGTLVGGLLARFPDLAALVTSGVCSPDRPGIVHRLDKGTSGLLAVARTPEAYRSLVGQLAERTMERRYLALVARPGVRRTGRGGGPDRALGPDADEDGSHGRGKARPVRPTQCQARFVGVEPATLLELALQSGRTHQIRVHMAAIGHPVVGDARYGMAGPTTRVRAILPARRLDSASTHPRSGERGDLHQPAARGSRGYLADLS